jgi:ubiquinone/menaquinone biosynthesis C-methylase UbiE
MTKMGKTEKWFMNRPGHSRNVADRAERLLQKISFKEGDKFLEIGCGNGSACKHIAKNHKLIVFGVDVDPDQIKNANKNIEKLNNIKFSVADATHLNFNENEFDIIYSSGVLHHIKDWQMVFKEINRILKPKGYYTFTDIAYSRFTTNLFKNRLKNLGFYTVDEIIDFLKNQDFDLVDKENPEGIMLKRYTLIFKKIK